MKLSEIKPKKKLKKKKRVGRGNASGKGKTSGRGTKGQRSREGEKKLARFSLILKLPKKRGTFRPRKRALQVINVQALNRFKEGSKVSLEVLEKEGLIKKASWPCKILGQGTLEKKLEVEATAFSKQARSKIGKAGGKVVLIK